MTARRCGARPGGGVGVGARRQSRKKKESSPTETIKC